MGTYLLLGNGTSSVSLLVAYSAIKRNAMAAYVGANARYGAMLGDHPKLAAAVFATPRDTAAVDSNV
jgi:hypothetical protein